MNSTEHAGWPTGWTALEGGRARLSQRAALGVRPRVRPAEDGEPYLPTGRARCPYRAAVGVQPCVRPAEDSEPYLPTGRARCPYRAAVGVQPRVRPAEDSEPYLPTGRARCPYRAAVGVQPCVRPAVDSEPYLPTGRARCPYRAAVGVRPRVRPAEDSEPYRLRLGSPTWRLATRLGILVGLFATQVLPSEFRISGWSGQGTVSEVRAVSMDIQGNIIITENDSGYVRRVDFMRLSP